MRDGIPKADLKLGIARISQADGLDPARRIAGPKYPCGHRGPGLRDGRRRSGEHEERTEPER
jgi:hypothetical protein